MMQSSRSQKDITSDCKLHCAELPILVAGTRGGQLHVLTPDTGTLSQTVQPVARPPTRAKSELCHHSVILGNFNFAL